MSHRERQQVGSVRVFESLVYVQKPVLKRKEKVDTQYATEIITDSFCRNAYRVLFGDGNIVFDTEDARVVKHFEITNVPAGYKKWIEFELFYKGGISDDDGNVSGRPNHVSDKESRSNENMTRAEEASEKANLSELPDYTMTRRSTRRTVEKYPNRY